MNTKRFFIIALILFILAGGSLVAYNFFLKDKGGPAPKNGDGELNLKPKLISQERIFAPTISENGQTIKYYAVSNGKVLQSTFDGSDTETISNVSLAGLVKIIWSPDKKKVISFFDKQGTITKYFYNYSTKTNVGLNGSIKGVTWSPDSQKIAYQYQSADGSNNNVSVANPDGTNWKNIFQTRLTDLVMEWPSPGKISARSKPSGTSKGFLFTLNSQSGEFSKVLDNIYGLSVKWSGDGQKLIYQETDKDGKNLKLYSAQSDASQLKEMPLITLPEKCVWSGDNQYIFCAVPQKITENAVWPDDYFMGKIAIRDDFYMVNLATNEKTKIAQSTDEQSFDAQDLLLSPQEDYIFFINRKDGFLYSIKLEL